MARSLGLDVGNRRIGVAVSDTLKVIARPIEVIDRRQQSAVNRIAILVREYQPDEIVIGYPWNTNGTAGEQAHVVEVFAEHLRSSVALPVRFYDERYSTGEAQEIIGTKKRKEKSQPDDAIAAAVILQRYLDEARRSTSEPPEAEGDEPAAYDPSTGPG